MAFPSPAKKLDDPDFLKPYDPCDFARASGNEESAVRESFLFRLDPQPGSRVVILAQSKTEPDWDYAFCNADHLLACRPEVKPFEPAFEKDSILRFRIRVNPVRSRVREKAQRGRRHDVVMNAKKQLQENPGAEAPDNLVRTEGLAWLKARAERHGFRVRDDDVRVSGYRQQRLLKPGRQGRAGDREERQIRFSTLDYDGLLTVADAPLFLATLKQGIGSAKGFGCGLLLVRRV
jgi:CRISPR system Cascade subunit CasE